MVHRLRFSLLWQNPQPIQLKGGFWLVHRGTEGRAAGMVSSMVARVLGRAKLVHILEDQEAGLGYHSEGLNLV